MSETQRPNVIVGGGIAGMIAALLLGQRGKSKVILIERESQLGGHLRCFDYGKNGLFDYGMHNMYETGISVLDKMLFELLPEEDWQVLEHGARDLAGAVFNGILQHNTPFPDMRNLPEHQWNSCVLDFFRQLETKEFQNQGNAWEDTQARFGMAIARRIDACLQKQFGKPAKELAPFATRLTNLSRVVLFSEEPFANLINCSTLRDRLAWPEQRTLPNKWQSGRRAYYPKKYGIYRVINALLVKLQEIGVEILTCAQVQSLERKGGQISNLKLEQAGSKKTVNVRNLIWTSGLPLLAQLFGEDLSGFRFDKARKTVLVNLLLREPPKMGDLYYFYCYESGCKTFRVTNFTAYCAGAPRASGWPISVELLLDMPLPDSEAIKETALKELKEFRVIESEKDVFFIAVEPLSSGFPMPSVNNHKTMSVVRNKILSEEIKNLTLLGVLSEENIFFQRDVLSHIWEKIVRIN